MRTGVLLVAWGLAACTVDGSVNGGGPANAAAASGSGGAGVGAGGSSGAGASMPVGVEAPSPRLLRQLTLNEYQSTVATLLQLSNPDTSAIPPDVPVGGYTTNVTGTFVTQSFMDAYSSVGAALSQRAVSESYTALVPCSTQDAACASAFIDAFGLRAFRRPLSDAEKARYTKLFDGNLTGSDFKQGVALVVNAMLISPYFLFRSELGVDVGQGQFKLSPYEVASALSYTYWGTMPDEPLFAAAKSGALANKTEIELQARRLLNDARGRSRIASFFYEWLESPRAYIASKDMATYPGLFKGPGGLSSLVDAMRAEEDAFVSHVVFDSSKKFDELFTANYTFANDNLAAYYGLPAPGSATAPVKVALPPGTPRGGLLTMGMFLLGHARTNQSSPTQRGHMIRANLLCTDIPPPPPNVNAVISQDTPGKTARQQITSLTSNGVCPTCHKLQDPIGFGLEGFDGAAQPRTVDNGEPVDSSGEIAGLEGTNAPLRFNGARELSTLLATSDVARSCLAANYYRYTRGFTPRGADAPAAAKLSQLLLDRNLDLPELFVQVALQDSFTARRSAETLAK